MEAFFVTLASYNPRTWVDRTPIRIAHNTRKRVFTCLRQELGAWKARQRQAEDVKATPERVPAGSIGSAPLGIDVDAVLAAIPACGPKEGAEVLMATDFGAESLRAVVLRMVGEPLDGERTYERLKRMRSRMKRRLREAIVASPMAR